MAGLARHDETEMECPFCEKGKIRVYCQEGYLQAKTSRISAGAKQTYHRVGEKHIVRDDCPACGKSKQEIQDVLEGKEKKEVDPNKFLERMKQAGLPTKIERKIR